MLKQKSFIGRRLGKESKLSFLSSPTTYEPAWVLATTLSTSNKNRTFRFSFYLVSRVGLEPTTPSLRGSCSNQLSYRPKYGLCLTIVMQMYLWRLGSYSENDFYSATCASNRAELPAQIWTLSHPFIISQKGFFYNMDLQRFVDTYRSGCASILFSSFSCRRVCQGEQRS